MQFTSTLIPLLAILATSPLTFAAPAAEPTTTSDLTPAEPYFEDVPFASAGDLGFVDGPPPPSEEEHKREIAALEDAKIIPRGFGCPGNQYQCHSHCKSIGGGRKGGYCGGSGWLKYLKLTCICYK